MGLNCFCFFFLFQHHEAWTHTHTHAMLHHTSAFSVCSSEQVQSGPVPMQASAMMSTQASMNDCLSRIGHCLFIFVQVFKWGLWIIHKSSCNHHFLMPHGHIPQFPPSPEVSESVRASSHTHDNSTINDAVWQPSSWPPHNEFTVLQCWKTNGPCLWHEF